MQVSLQYRPSKTDVLEVVLTIKTYNTPTLVQPLYTYDTLTQYACVLQTL